MSLNLSLRISPNCDHMRHAEVELAADDGQIILQPLANACDHSGVLALCDLIAADHAIPRDGLASFGIDVLLFQSVARFPVDPTETDFFAQGGCRIERNGGQETSESRR